MAIFPLLRYINLLFPPESCDRFIFHYDINLFGTYLDFYKGSCTVFFTAHEQKEVTLPHSVHRKHAFLVKTEEIFKPQK